MRKKTKKAKKTKRGRKCIGCGKTIHPKRIKILPKTKHCVDCSNVSKKAGITITLGEGDHTYNETIILDQNDYNKLYNSEYHTVKRSDRISHPDDEDENLEDLEEDAS